MRNSEFSEIEEAISDFQAGRMVIVVDDEDRENEGDLIVAAEKVTPEAINFMATFAKGLICMPMTGERLDDLEIQQMVEQNTESMQTAFTVSVDAITTTTGISAFERAQTVRMIIDPATRPADLRRPGHIFPLRAKEGGVLRRTGHTEAAVDLARLAGLYPAGVICEIMNDDGTMARVPQLLEFSKKHGLKIITIADLIRYRRRTEKLVRLVATTNMPTKYGEFQAKAYETILDGNCHLALIMGELDPERPTLVESIQSASPETSSVRCAATAASSWLRRCA